MTVLKLIYLANAIVAGYVGAVSLFAPKISATTIFSNAYPTTEVLRLVGCLWLAIAVVSCLGFFKPLIFSPVLLVQFLYKSCWLLMVALPAIKTKTYYPVGIALFFLIWVLVLPFVIPWQEWLRK